MAENTKNTPSFIQRLKRLFGVSERDTPATVAKQMEQSSSDFNKKLLQKRVEHSRHHSTNVDPESVPERWYTVTYDELFAYHLRSHDPRMASSLPDSAWGLLQEAGGVFAKNGHTLAKGDFDELVRYAKDDEDIHNLTLAILYQRKYERNNAQDGMRLRTLKIRGH